MNDTTASEQMDRRRFLQLAAVAAGGIAASGPASGVARAFAPLVQQTPQLSMWIQEYYVPEANAVIEEAARAAAERGNFEITVEWLPWDDASYSKWAAALEANQLPDIGMPPGYPSQYAALDRLVDLSDLMTAIGDDGGGWYDYVLNDATMNGKQYWVPIFNETAFGYYRTDLFDAAGFSVPLPGLDELLDAAKAITKPEESIWGLGLGMSHGDWAHNLLPVMWDFGARYQDEQGNITVDTPEMVEAVTWYTDLYTRYKVVPSGATSWDPSSNNKGYLAGQLAFISNPGSVLGTMRTDFPDLLEKTRLAPFPGRGDSGPQASANFPGLFVTTNSQFPEQAQSVIRTLMSEEFYPKFLEAAASNFLPVLQGYTEIPFFQNDPWNQQIISDILPYAKPRAWAGIGTPTFSEVDSSLLWGQMLQRVCVDGWEPERAVDEFASKVREIEAKYKG